MSGITWLASYPKSGNTWFRIFLSNLLKGEEEEVTINQLKTDGIFSSRHILNRYSGVECSNLTMDEIDRLRPKVYDHLSHLVKRNFFVKVHDAYTYLEDGSPLLGTFQTKAVYILRNPLDVAVSFANHSSKSFSAIVENMGDQNFSFCANENRMANQTRQMLLTWSMHVTSWTEAKEIPVNILRYEDMKQKPLETFTKAVRFIGLDYTEAQIQSAIELSDFNRIKKEESHEGFREKPYKTESFFRKGQVGDWKNHLTEMQAEQIISDHSSVMRKFGYLDEYDRPLY